MNGDDEFNEPYLPARYRQKVREKQQRRRQKKILIAGIIIAVVIAVIWILAGFFQTVSLAPAVTSPVPATTPVPAVTTTPVPVEQSTPVPAAVPAITTASVITTPVPDETASSATGYIIAPGVPVDSTGSALSLSGAVDVLRNYYSEEDYTITKVNYTTTSVGSLFGFTITSTTGGSESTIFIDAATGKPYAFGQETTTISEDKVKGIATSAFPDAGASTIRTWYYNSPDKGGIWMFILASGNTTLITGSLDATTGELVSFRKKIPSSGRREEPTTTLEKAQATASHYISEKNGGTLPLNLTSSRYEAWGTPSAPSAGQYLFSWERLYLDHPVDTDGISVTVDAESGEVIGYDKQWSTPDFAFSRSVDQTIIQRDATFAVMQEAKKRYPDSVESIRVLSAELRWNNNHDPATSQLSGTVPLEWKIVFDDAVIRADSSLPIGTGWVDIQMGNVTEMHYRH
ncbi:YcdB/YcdC domain-containing protein [Methanoregula sp.]|uniref:YcdB/YcdC domain-containing protein n=1 Tax=Methanoregula sp. TaxID=2052170 RepID=UPI0023737C03|nr:YcdB/YcdC domain-containing protein [Methanoregula sp.]MDD1685410.1 hypothetical protein [Methanoregula sp.]